MKKSTILSPAQTLTSSFYLGAPASTVIVSLLSKARSSGDIIGIAVFAALADREDEDVAAVGGNLPAGAFPCAFDFPAGSASSCLSV